VRIFLDTNVLASALTTRGLCAELFEVVLQSHDLLISEAVFRELQRILPEKLGQTEAITNGFIALLRAEGQVITAEHPLPKLPDPDDEAILAAALAGKANAFVTGDKALLNLESVEGLPIITPRGLWESLADK
jgi:putative PIN family toxin of toxin-antitoxin system